VCIREKQSTSQEILGYAGSKIKVSGAQSEHEWEPEQCGTRSRRAARSQIFTGLFGQCGGINSNYLTSGAHATGNNGIIVEEPKELCGCCSGSTSGSTGATSGAAGCHYGGAAGRGCAADDRSRKTASTGSIRAGEQSSGTAT
jgi:hypothetical protein